jgi:hypothetical protein
MLYSVAGTCKHLGIDPLAYLREVLPALFALGDSPEEEALACWLPDAWLHRRHRASTVPLLTGREMTTTYRRPSRVSQGEPGARVCPERAAPALALGEWTGR